MNFCCYYSYLIRQLSHFKVGMAQTNARERESDVVNKVVDKNILTHS